MEFINQAYSQLVELIRSMSAGTRLATVLLLVLVVVSLTYLVQYQANGGDELLLAGRSFTPSELAAIETAFAKAGLGKSQITGSQIRIPRGKKELYLAALADGSALPADFYKYLDDAIKADNPFSSPRTMDARLRTAKQRELALIIGRMTGIESATVQYDEEIKRGLSQSKQKTAMVAVQTRSGHLEEDQVKAIRNVVASAYAGLDRHNITITDLSGATYGGAIGPDGVPEDESAYVQSKVRYEREFQRKIQDQLKYIPGVIVGVNAILNPETVRSIQSLKVDPKPVATQTREITKEEKTHSPGTAGRPGAVSNGVETQGNRPLAISTSAGGPESEKTETRSDIQNVPGYDTTITQIAPLIPQKITASIDIPASYYVEIWKKRNPPVADKPAKSPDVAEIATIETETKKRIQETVRNLLPDFDKGTNPYPHVVVETYTDLPKSPVVPPPTLAQSGTTWLADNWQTVGLIVIACASLLMLRSMVRSSPVHAPSAAAVASSSATGPRLALHESADEEDTPEPARALKARFGVSAGPDLRAELRDIVKDNPDAAASILRAWIGEAA
jgi:flagellar M-ring protein FliF